MLKLLIPLVMLLGCGTQATNNISMEDRNTGKYEQATFGQGCFWCAEAIFKELDGVVKVESGYSGGKTANPTYKEVCSGQTGHAEVVQITYDPSKISYDELLEVFWKTHDPTTLNRQGNDVGTQYRSVIFYHNEEQKRLAEAYKKKLIDEKIWDKPIVTEISPFTHFYKAEDYHQNYYENNPNQAYCQYVIVPKLEKFEKIFKAKIKKGH
jgi:peptide-methionine (S)-S-oxide reductase